MIPKFKAWDKYHEIMVIIISIDFENKIAYVEQENGDRYDIHFDNLIFLQSTGLKDKNGVEIFEGDVVKISDGSNEEDSYTSVVKNYADEGYPAFDIEAPSSWYYESNILATIMGGEYETIEVIGNVWEDGDLINDSEGAEEN